MFLLFTLGTVYMCVRDLIFKLQGLESPSTCHHLFFIIQNSGLFTEQVILIHLGNERECCPNRVTIGD